MAAGVHVHQAPLTQQVNHGRGDSVSSGTSVSLLSAAQRSPAGGSWDCKLTSLGGGHVTGHGLCSYVCQNSRQVMQDYLQQQDRC